MSETYLVYCDRKLYRWDGQSRYVEVPLSHVSHVEQKPTKAETVARFNRLRGR